MKLGLKVAIGAVVLAAVAAGGYKLTHKAKPKSANTAGTKGITRLETVKGPKIDNSALSADLDDRVTIRAEHPANLQDEKNLKGRSLWVSAAGEMNYYPYNGRTVDFTHPMGVLLGADRIDVIDAIEVVAPKNIETQFPDGDADVMLVFHRPKDFGTANRTYAVAVGDREGHDYNLITDQLFFYDDPHFTYSHWGPKVWRAIDAHTAMIGMSVRQLQMALGQFSTPRGDIMGDATIEFDNQGKLKLITFAKGRAVQIQDETQ